MTWFPLYTLLSPTLSQISSSISCIDTFNITAVANTGRIYHTTNVGIEWTLQFTSFTANNLKRVFFIDENNGYILSDNELFKTSDGGKNWNVKNIGGSDISFSDKNNGIIVGNDGYKTTNSGETWFPINLSGELWGGEHLALDYINLNVAFIVNEAGSIFKTTDGGNNWIKQDSGLSGLVSISFSDVNHGLIVGNLGSHTSIICRTSNSGKTWTKFINTNSLERFNAVSLLDTINALIAGNVVLKTSDFGISWQKITSSTFTTLNDIIYVDENNAHAVDNHGNIISTTNGWIDWLQLSLTKESLLGIAAIDKNNVIAVGDLGVILSTKNISNIPVKLSSFTASQNKNNILLTWQTITETNNKGFEVQRKSSNGEYINLAFVNGNGTTTSPQNYSYSDVNVPSGNYTYRLKQIDFDGSFE